MNSQGRILLTVYTEEGFHSRVEGTGFNKKDGRDTRIQFEGVGYDKPLDVIKIASSLVPPPGTP